MTWYPEEMEGVVTRKRKREIEAITELKREEVISKGIPAYIDAIASYYDVQTHKFGFTQPDHYRGPEKYDFRRFSKKPPITFR